ncbi:unnamed protein product [Aphanomyces euteiches]
MPDVAPEVTTSKDNSLFDALIVIAPDITDITICRDMDSTFEPVVCHTYPQHVAFESIEHFCYPNGIQIISDDHDDLEDHGEASSNDYETDSDNGQSKRTNPLSFIFLISGGGKDGQDLQYAFCLQKWVRIPNQLLLHSRGGNHYAPLTYCMVAKTPFIPFFTALLNQLMGTHQPKRSMCLVLQLFSIAPNVDQVFTMNLHLQKQPRFYWNGLFQLYLSLSRWKRLSTP